MQLEIGSIYSGKVSSITDFGAFVTLENGKTGMVHISEVSNSYVKSIRDILTENQEVKVKLISISEEGKISLSISQAMSDDKNNQKKHPTGPVRRGETAFFIPRSERCERYPAGSCRQQWERPSSGPVRTCSWGR